MSKNPEKSYLLNEWDSELNDLNNFTINNVTIGSEKPLHWVCNKGHKFVLDAYSRTKRGRNCPYCNSSRLLKGFNDLASQNPEILVDWDYNKNDVKPDEIFQHAKRKVWWKCHKCGHEWEAAICRRTTNIRTGCPQCHTNSTSIPEMSIYLSLKNVFNEVEHRKIINDFEYDIFIQDINLAIEYDGIRFHGENGKRIDSLKSLNATDNNFNFVRIKETLKEDLHGNFVDNTLYISEYHRHKIHNTCSLVLETIKNKFNLNINCNVSEDIILQARKQIKLVEIENSLASRFPYDAEEWCYELNGEIKPEYVSPRSDIIKYWWKCKRCGNVYQKSTYDKTNSFRNGGCPKCIPSYKTSVVCIDTNEFYISISEASRKNNNINVACIGDVCRGKQKTAGKLHWRYATEQEIKEGRVIDT